MVLKNPLHSGDKDVSSSGGKSAADSKSPGEQPILDSSESPTLVDVGSVPKLPPLRSTSSDADSPTLVDLGSSAGLTAEAVSVRTRSSTLYPPQFGLTPGVLVAGRYEILEVLGEGGMGAVYKAKDRELDRLVALKVIRPELARNPDILQRFKQEILLSSKITHRNVVRIYDLGDAEGFKFITMEYVEGEDLHHALKRHGKFGVNDAVGIIEQLFSGLGAAHREGIIHRDLKPGNIMLDASGRVVVMDFGLARSVASDGMTRTGLMVGTMEYMSPEQAQAKDLDERSDIFTVGLIFYELLTGKMPYQADSAVASLLKRTQERAAPVSSHDAAIPGSLSSIVAKCLEPDPKLRYQNTAEVLADLDNWRGKGAAATLRFPDVRPWASHIPWPWIAALATVLVLAGTGFLLRNKLFGPRTAAVPSAPVSVLVADFQNNTSESVFDGTLEPTFNLALEGASFITAYNRGDAHKAAQELKPGSGEMDESLARLVAQREGINIVVSGSVAKAGTGYKLLSKVTDAVTGKVINTEVSEASDKSSMLRAVAALAGQVRTDLGDTTPESSKLAQAETFTSASLEAAHEYAEAQAARYSGKTDEAIKGFRRAIEFDPKFGSAYAGLAALYWNQGNRAEAMNYYKQALEHIDRMTDREKYRTRGGYYLAVSDGDKAVEEFSALVKQYPADSMGLSALAHAYYLRHDMSHAVEASHRAMEIYPKNLVYHNNEALYALFAQDYVTAEREAQAVLAIDPSYEDALITMALTETAKGNFEKATEYWHKIGSASATGPSTEANGLADLALYRSDPASAITALEKGVAADLEAKSQVGAAKKYVVFAEAYIMQGKKAEAVQSVDRAVAMSKADVLFPAAHAYVLAGEFGKAAALASELSKQLDETPQAFGKLIEGDIQLGRGKPRQAIQLFQDSKRLSDSWLARFDLARAYLEAGAYTDANSELEICLTRRGEATDIYIDEQQTFRYFPPTYYYLGRALEGLKSPGAADAYRNFLAMKVPKAQDPMVDDATKRLAKM